MYSLKEYIRLSHNDTLETHCTTKGIISMSDIDIQEFSANNGTIRVDSGKQLLTGVYHHLRGFQQVGLYILGSVQKIHKNITSPENRF